MNVSNDRKNKLRHEWECEVKHMYAEISAWFGQVAKI